MPSKGQFEDDAFEVSGAMGVKVSNCKASMTYWELKGLLLTMSSMERVGDCPATANASRNLAMNANGLRRSEICNPDVNERPQKSK